MSSQQKNKDLPDSSTEKKLEQAASIILKVFQRYDVDKSGTLQRRELRHLLRKCGAKLSSHQCDSIIDQLDTDEDGEMNFAEFMSLLGRLYQLQFFGTDPEMFWNKTSSDNAMKRQQPQDHTAIPSQEKISPRKLPTSPSRQKTNNLANSSPDHAANYPLKKRPHRPPPLPPTSPLPTLSSL